MDSTGGFLEPFLGPYLPWLYVQSVYWTAIGLFGNVLFGSRFFIQWLYSEKSKKVVVPPVFWYISFWGSLISLFYALHIDKLPIIIGVAALPIVYGRNLVLLRKGQKQPQTSADSSADGGS